MQTFGISFKRHRFPSQIVAHAVWLYLRFNLSLREVEEMLLERGIDVSYETVRRWIAKFGPQIARNLRRRQSRPGDVCYLDEVVVKCAGEKFWLWRAVDQHGFVLEEILQKRRDKRAAMRLLVALMKRYRMVPKRIITDKLRSYGAAKADVAPGLNHWSHRGHNNRAENSHLPFRKRNEPCKGIDRRERYKSSSRCIPPPAIAFQFRPADERHKQFAITASKRWMRGELLPAPLERCGAETIAPLGKLNVTTPRKA